MFQIFGNLDLRNTKLYYRHYNWMKQEKKWFFTISPCHIFQHRLCSHKALPWEEKINFFESKHLVTRPFRGGNRSHRLFASFVCSFITYYTNILKSWRNVQAACFIWLPDWIPTLNARLSLLWIGIEIYNSLHMVAFAQKNADRFAWFLLMLHNCWRGKEKKYKKRSNGG